MNKSKSGRAIGRLRNIFELCWEFLDSFSPQNSGYHGGFPGGPAVTNLPSNEGDIDLIHSQGTKIPHASGQLSPQATITELSPSGAHVPQLERSPHAAAKSLCDPHATAKIGFSQIK